LALVTHSKNINPIFHFLFARADYLFAFWGSLILFAMAIHKYGIGVTFDSINYLSAGLTATEGMKKADGSIFYEWPPLYPWILSISKLLSVNIIKFATVFNFVTYSTNILLTYSIIKQNVRDKILQYLALFILLFSIPLLQVHILIWSEPFFILLVLFNLLILKKYVEQKKLSFLILLSVVSLLLQLQRKAGVYFMMSNVLLIIYYNRKKFVLHTLFYFSVSVFTTASWFISRHQVSGIYFGSSKFAPSELGTLIQQFLNTFTTYFFPLPIPLSIRVFILLTILAALFLYFLKNKINFFFLVKQNQILFLSGAFTFIYYSTLILSLLYFHLSEDIDDRILSPAFLPFIIFLFLFLDQLQINFTKTAKSILNYCIVLWLVYGIGRTYHNLKRWNNIGTGGYNRIEWYQSKVIQDLYKEDTKQAIITNNVEALTYHLNFLRNKNFTILPMESKVRLENGLLVCFPSNLTNPDNTCKSEQWPDKVMILNSREGKIWKFKNQN
jgi:hypothetical protein